MANEVKRDTAMELNFLQEIKNGEKLGAIFKKNQQIKVPKIYHEFTTSRIITMTFEKGVFLTDVKAIDELNLNHHDILRLISNAYTKQIFQRGFIHCDPHSVTLTMMI